MNKIVKVRKDAAGSITEVMFDNGTVYPLTQAVDLATQGMIMGVIVGTSKTGSKYLRGKQNETETDNLDNLPTF